MRELLLILAAFVFVLFHLPAEAEPRYLDKAAELAKLDTIAACQDAALAVAKTLTDEDADRLAQAYWRCLLDNGAAL